MNGFFKKNQDNSSEKETLGEILKAQESIPEALRTPEKKVDSLKLITLPIGNFRTELRTFLKGLPDNEQLHWVALIEHANTAVGKSKPSQRWLKNGEVVMDNINKEIFSKACERWLNSHKPAPKNPDASLEVLQGLIWLCTTNPLESLIIATGNFAETCYRKVPGVGPRSQKLGNACLYALKNLALQGHNYAVEQLVRIRVRTIYPNVIKAVNSSLKEISENRHVSQRDLEESCLPTFAFDDEGKLRIEVDNLQAELTISGTDCLLVWTDPTGVEVKKLLKNVKKSHGETIAEIEALQKYLKTSLSVQAKNLEQSYQTKREWPFDIWVKRYWHHPLRRPMIERMIWIARDQKSLQSFMVKGASAFDNEGNSLQKCCPETVISLWHPLRDKADEVLKWQNILVNKWMAQPFKQVSRETFTLVDRERETLSYSNRFAAHVLHHTQFAVLCRKFGWKYKEHSLMDAETSAAVKLLPDFGLTVEFVLMPIANKKASVPPYAKTDRLLFRADDSNCRNLVDLPSVLFSEIMREVNMIIHITSIADDLNWVDDSRDKS